MIIIPARLNSSRFENKVLVDILGLPMVIRTAMQVANLDKVVIATDSQDIVNLAESYGISAVLTSSYHKSGTDRINEASDILKLDSNEIIINVQADEPFIEPSVIQKVIDKIKQNQANLPKESFNMVSCYKDLPSNLADDPNHVKVVLDQKDNAIYFSRGKIPHHRDSYDNTPYKGHLGIYGFTKQSLEIFCSLTNSTLEHIEKLEQLRVIESNYNISMVKVDSKSFGIDTQEDLENAIMLQQI